MLVLGVGGEVGLGFRGFCNNRANSKLGLL